jgi:exocyst complex component 2
MNRCQQEHAEKEDEEEKELLRSSSLSPSKNIHQNSSFKSGGKPPQRFLFVEELTKMLCDNVPEFWRLGQSYLSGKLLKEQVTKATRADPAKQLQFKQMLHDVIALYVRLVRSAFLPHTLIRPDPKRALDPSSNPWREQKQDSHLAWLPVCVRQVRSCIMLLLPLELPAESTDILHSLVFDLRWNSLTTLLKQAIQDTRNLHERETWVIDTDDERGGTTTLPTVFENIVSETVHTLQEVVNARPAEKLLFAEPASQKIATELCVTLLHTFATTLQRLALTETVERRKQSKKAQQLNMRSVFAKTHYEGVPTLDKRLIIVLNNCTLTVEHILPRLIDSFDKHGYPEVGRIQMLSKKAYVDVDKQLFDRYIEEKANPLIGALEQNMYKGMFDWSACYPLTGVRSYVKESIMSLLEVHEEVYSIGPTFVERVMCQIVEQVADEMNRLFQCVAKFSSSGAIQAKLDICAFDKAVGIYKTSHTRSSIKEALGHVSSRSSSSSPADNKTVNNQLELFTKHMHFQLMCFQAGMKAERK